MQGQLLLLIIVIIDILINLPNNIECSPTKMVKGPQSFFLHPMVWNNYVP